MMTTWPDGTPRSQNNAFASVPPRGIDKPCIAPKKRGPKPKSKTKVQQAKTPKKQKERKSKERKLMDQQGRPRVDLAPRTSGAIRIHSQADAAKTSKIKRGRAI